MNDEHLENHVASSLQEQAEPRSSTSIVVHLPIPPSVNAMYRNLSKPGVRGRVKTKEYLAWVKEADDWLTARKQYLKRWRIPGVPHFTGECELEIKIPAKTRGDCSNRIKAVEDFLVSRHITADDRHNRKVSIERDASVDCCVVTITGRAG